MANDERMEWKDRSKVVDLTDKGLLTGETVELNFEADAWLAPAPPPMGCYDLKIFPAKEFMKMVLRDEKKGWDAPGNIFYMANLECRIVSNNSDYNNIPVFASVSSIVGRGRELSTMMGLVKLAGVTPKRNSLTDLEQAKVLDLVLKKEPIIRGVFLDWEGYSKNDKKSVCRSMTDFPKNSDGSYQHSYSRVDGQRDKEEITAQLRVKDWVGKPQTASQGSQGSQVSNGAMVSAQQVQAPLAPPAPAPNVDVSDLESLLV